MGTTEVFPSVTVHRYGARNVRAALQYVSNLISTERYNSDLEGYRPDQQLLQVSNQTDNTQTNTTALEPSAPW
jgi:hypothetical protein